MSTWTLFSNHGHVLFCLARNPESRLRDVAADVGITERAVQKIVRNLQDGGMVSVTKHGRRNSYRIDTKKSLRHELEAACTLKDLIKVVNKGEGEAHSRVANVKVIEELQPGRNEPSEISVKPESTRVEEKQLAQAGPVTVAAREPGRVKIKQVKINKDKPKKTDSKERQQGSLF